MKSTDLIWGLDPQQQPSKPCPRCGKETYSPTYHCIFCAKCPPTGADAHTPVFLRGVPHDT